jgi:hypothetical protein
MSEYRDYHDETYSVIKLYNGEIDLLKLMDKEYHWSYTNEDSLLKKIVKQIIRAHEGVIKKRIIITKRK